MPTANLGTWTCGQIGPRVSEMWGWRSGTCSGARVRSYVQIGSAQPASEVAAPGAKLPVLLPDHLQNQLLGRLWIRTRTGFSMDDSRSTHTRKVLNPDRTFNPESKLIQIHDCCNFLHRPAPTMTFDLLSPRKAREPGPDPEPLSSEVLIPGLCRGLQRCGAACRRRSAAVRPGSSSS